MVTISYLVYVIKNPWGTSNTYDVVNVSNGNNIKKNKDKKRKLKGNSSKIKRDDLEFDEEARLWGLNEDEKRIAKEEGMSPADFIEAEERNDDELIDDDF